ncbi:MAG: hypothetical protein AAB436_01130 [Patescibacteria group bacterium]
MAETEQEGFFKPETDTEPAVNNEAVTWQASEFVHHDKSVGWYFTLVATAVLVSAVFYLITKDVVSAAVPLVCALLLAIYGARHPRQLLYQMDTRGIQIGDKYHDYDEFRSFSLMPEGAFTSIIFMPLRRFAMTTTIYFAPEDQERITALLTGSLPYEEHQLDATDRFIKNIRF